MSKLDELQKERKEEAAAGIFVVILITCITVMALAVAIEFSPTIGAIVFVVPMLIIGFIVISKDKGSKDSDDAE